MHKLKLFLLFLLTFIIAFSFVGCANTESSVEKYLTNKYKENFTVDSVNEDKTEYQCHSYHWPEYEFTVKVDGRKKTDNYFVISMRYDFDEILAKTIDSYLNKYQVFYKFDNEYLNNKINDRSAIRDYISEYPEDFNPHIYIYVPTGTDISDNSYYDIQDSISSLFTNCTVTISYISESDMTKTEIDNHEDYSQGIYNEFTVKDGKVV